MKKIVSFLLIVTLFCSLSITGFATPAYETLTLEEFNETYSDFFGYTVQRGDGIIYFSNAPFYVSKETGNPVITKGRYVSCSLNEDDSTVYVRHVVSNTSSDIQALFNTTTDRLIFAGENIYYATANYATNVIVPTTELYYSVEPEEGGEQCDGSTCPANDFDFDNICDDCGKVLTYSLRSTLLDYAKNLAETDTTFSETHKYYAVVEHPSDTDRYIVYISEILMGGSDNGVVTGGNMKKTTVLTMETGAFANQGWSSAESWTGTIVYANHTIPNFYRVPLMMTVQGPTGEQIQVGTLTLTEVFSILTRCGVGLMVLLLSLHLLSTWFRKTWLRG